MKKIKILIEGVEVETFWLEQAVTSRQNAEGNFTTFLTLCFEGQVAELSQIAAATGQDSVLQYFK